MAASTFYIPSVNVIGSDSLKDAMNTMAEYGFRPDVNRYGQCADEVRYGGRYSKSIAAA